MVRELCLAPVRWLLFVNSGLPYTPNVGAWEADLAIMSTTLYIGLQWV